MLRVTTQVIRPRGQNKKRVWQKENKDAVHIIVHIQQQGALVSWHRGQLVLEVTTPHYFSFFTSTYQNPLPYPQTVAGWEKNPMLIHTFLPFACFSLDPFCIIWKHFFPDNQTSFYTSARSILLLLSRDKCVQRHFCMLVCVGLSACVVCIYSYFCPRGLQYVCVCVVASMFFPAALSKEEAWTPSLDRPWGFPHITEHSWCTSAVQPDLKTSPQPLRCSFFAHRFVSVQRGCRKSWQMILLQCCFRWHNIILHPRLIDSNHPWPACTYAIERSFKFSLAVVPNITNTSDWDPDHRVGLA